MGGHYRWPLPPPCFVTRIAYLKVREECITHMKDFRLRTVLSELRGMCCALHRVKLR
jgi:hypothetical protein